MARTCLDYAGVKRPMPQPAFHKLVGEFGNTDKGGYMIELWQSTKHKDRFAVVYGLHLTTDLSYEDAALALGSAIMHHWQNEGYFD